MKMAVTPVRRQLERLERAGLLVARQIGRSCVYQFDPRSPVAMALKELVRLVYEAVPLPHRQRTFSKRRRPTSKDKPVLNRHD